MAPLTPFITERVWQDLFARPAADAARVRAPGRLAEAGRAAGRRRPRRAGALARRLVELGRAARAEAKVRTRQPLRRALVPSAAPTARRGAARRGRRRAQRRRVESLRPPADLVDHAAKGNFRALGKRFAQDTPKVAAAIAAADAAALAAALAADGRATVVRRRRAVEVSPTR